MGNYTQFSYCPICSDKLKRCMVCGGDAPLPGTRPPADRPPLADRSLSPNMNGSNRPLSPNLSGSNRQLSPNLNGSICDIKGDSNAVPVFCSAHSTSDQRVKKEPEMRECRKCCTRLHTNYAQFTLCPACSAGDGRCMICGSSVPVDGRKEPLPAPPPPATQQDREKMTTAKAARTVSRTPTDVPPPP